MMKSNSNVQPSQKKRWIKPCVEIISSGNIESGSSQRYHEAEFTPAHQKLITPGGHTIFASTGVYQIFS